MDNPYYIPDQGIGPSLFGGFQQGIALKNQIRQAKAQQDQAAMMQQLEAEKLKQAKFQNATDYTDAQVGLPTAGAPLAGGLQGPSAPKPMPNSVTIPWMEKQNDWRKQVALAKANQKPDLKRLPTTGINMQDLSSFPVDLKNLASLADKIESNIDVVGPWAGRASGVAGSILPTSMQPDWAVRGQELQSDIANLKQTIGKFKEGGVLRKEDEDKYTRILADVQNNPKVAKGKIKRIYEEMAQKYNNTLRTLNAQQYDTSGLGLVNEGAMAGGGNDRMAEIDAILKGR